MTQLKTSKKPSITSLMSLNSIDNFSRLAIQFRQAFNQPRALTLGSLQMQSRLIAEEAEEVREAAEELAKDLTNRRARSQLFKEVIDLLYVCFQLLVCFRWPAWQGFVEVHESNMSKLGEDGKPIYREDGKVLKGPNYKTADLTWLV